MPILLQGVGLTILVTLGSLLLSTILGLVWALLKHKLWAYPLSIIVFAAFIVYQLYRFTFTRGLGLIALSLFDLVVIWLIYLEYRALKQRRAGVSRV